MNLTTALVTRIEEYRKDNKNPCKNYATAEAADKAGAKVAQSVANYFSKDVNTTTAKPCRYLVVYCPEWQRYCVGLDFTELLARSTMTGGYLGIAPGFFKF